MREIVVYTLMFSAMLQFFMAVYAWGRRNEPAAKPLLFVFILGGVWALAYGLEIAAVGLPAKIFWMQTGWAAASFGPLVFLLIVLEHLELTHVLTRGRLAILLIPSITIISLVWTVPHHTLMIYDFSVVRVAGLDILQKSNGPLYYPVFLVLQGISIVSYYLLIRSLPNSSPAKRRQTITIFIALLIPFLVNMPAILKINPIQGFDFTPHALVISSGLYAFAIFRYRWLDIIPMARTALVETIPVGVIVTDAKNRIVDINPSAKRLLQIDDSVIGRDSQTALAHFDEFLYTHMGTDMLNKEIKVQFPTGQSRHLEVHTVPLENQEGQFNGRILTLQDVTEHKQASERLQAQLNEIASLHDQLHEQAIRDPLTGLFNRRYMSDALEREMRRAERHQRPLGILMIEIDNFKQFNDSFGHDAGDLTLKKVAELVQVNIRADDIPCRFGGDEFILILPETALEAASQCAERLRENASVFQLEYEGKPLSGLTLSIGVAVFPKHGETGALALRAADEAMYQAKQTGKNRVIVAKD